MPLPPRKDSVDEFVTWLTSNGAKFEKVMSFLFLWSSPPSLSSTFHDRLR